MSSPNSSLPASASIADYAPNSLEARNYMEPPSYWTQRDMLRNVRHQLKGHVWAFSCDAVAGMASPRLADKTPLIEDPTLEAALAAAPLPTAPALDLDEEENYGPLAGFIEEATNISDAIYTEVYKALNLVEPARRWCPRLVFRKYDKTTAEDAEGPVSLVPENTDQVFDFRADWSLVEVVNGERACPVRVPVEVGSDWDEILLHAATYANACQSATPLRQFVTCVGFNYITKEFCAFVFHAGGAAASDPLSLDTEEARRSFVRFIFAVGLWQNAEDAGDTPFFNGGNIAMPSPVPGGPPVMYKMEKVLHQATSFFGKRTFVVQMRRTISGDPPMNTAGSLGIAQDEPSAQILS